MTDNAMWWARPTDTPPVPNFHMLAAVYAFEQVPIVLSIGDRITQGMRHYNFILPTQTISDASPYDTMQVGRYFGELLHIRYRGRSGTPRAHWKRQEIYKNDPAAAEKVAEFRSGVKLR